MTKYLCAAWAAGLALSLVTVSACSKGEHDYQTWTDQLGNQREQERALTELEQLGDPRAIPALGKAWEEQGKPPRMLQVIIGLAPPLSASEAAAKNFTDFDGQEGRPSGRQASWDDAAPFLIEAVTSMDDANTHSVESAAHAATAIGDGKIAGGMDALIELANKPQSKKVVEAEVEAVRALGKFDSDKGKAVNALVKVISADTPTNPLKVAPGAERKAAAERYAVYQAVTNTAIVGLGQLRSPDAVPALLSVLYRAPDLFSATRGALVAIGQPAEQALIAVLNGTNNDVNQLFKDKKLDRYCGDKGDATGDQCQPVSAKDYGAAVVLGDFYDPKSVPALLTAMVRPPLPVAYQDDAPSPNTQLNAVFDALRKIGSAEGADKVRAMWEGKTAAAPAAPPGPAKPGAPAPAAAPAGVDAATKTLAISAYPFVSHDNAGVDDLGKIAADNTAEDNLRQEAALAYARLAADPKGADVLNGMAQKYFDASAKKRTEADAKKADADASNAEFEKARKLRDDTKAQLLKDTHDKAKSADDIKASTATAKKAEDDFKTISAKNKAVTAPYKQLDRAAKDYKSFARMFQTHIARIQIAITCKGNLDCYAKTLSKKPDDAANDCAGLIKDIKDWTADEKVGLLEGEIERAMLELGKQGQKASQYTDLLLDNAKSDDRVIRQSILLALPKIAKVPCDNCETKLQIAIKAGEGKSTLGELNVETTMMLNYFSWAGGRTPKAAAAAPAANAEAPAADGSAAAPTDKK